MQSTFDANEFKQQKTLPGVDVKVSEKKRLELAFKDNWLYWCKDRPGLLMPTSQFMFHPQREWRIDFAFKPELIAIECQGGIYRNGGHNRGAYMEECYDKRLEAALLGWITIELGPNFLKKKHIADTLERVEKLIYQRRQLLGIK